ncbi:3-oxoadipyl-CoA thiolase [Ignatzschineria sp. RMDPL8A]|uniref:3-oxoadipyl-CoA thiolase n=1 Tax=Ignatzschineria sp. RMDPL8A TaxID=2999236 RepID=UPI002A5BE4C6|nr:3-oxoadipyl-CoA thiolase [Ignatzschineria sp. RMDPL8A]
MKEAYICDAIRTPIGRYGGALASIRADDLAALPLIALQERHPNVDWKAVEDIILGCANQAGEDNRNVARMAGLLSGLPLEVPGTTINRLCGSGMDAVGMAARAIKAGDAELLIAGGVESMTRAPFVQAKQEKAWGRAAELYDTTIGWRFPNPKMEAAFGVHTMPETADNVAAEFTVSREDQDLFALRSQEKWVAAEQAGKFQDEIIPVTIERPRQEPYLFDKDEHPRPDTNLEKLARLKGVNGADLTVTAGNASGINDGACALLIASNDAVERYGLIPKAKIVAMAARGVRPEVMGIGPIPAVEAVLEKAGLTLDDIDLIELNEAFAAQSLAVIRGLGLSDDDPRINPNGGAIAMGHPLGMSGARLVTTAMYELIRTQKRYALCTMCIGVGQGIAIIIERV